MPVYNGAVFLASAIDSILNQSFSEFELIIINDGSTDESEKIILSYSDHRIVYIRNEKNLGLVNSLNKCIKICKGEFIARMDADDISLPDRLQTQVNFLRSNQHFAMVASVVQPVDAKNNYLGLWSTDSSTINEGDIRSMLSKTNCIAHPSVMMRADVAKRLLYRAGAKASEDYDLWLRMLARGLRIAKIKEPLLLYRMHQSSVMAGAKGTGDQNLRVFYQKTFFLKYALSHLLINSFFFKVVYSSLRSLAAYFRTKLFRLLKDIKYLLQINPFSAFAEYNRLASTLLNHDASLIFFFPYTHMGGAERVHSDIVNAFPDQKCMVVFTGFSKDSSFLQAFKHSGSEVLVIPGALYSPLVRAKSRNLLIRYINSGRRRGIFGSNSEYYFHLLPHLNRDLFCADLIHAFKFQPEGNLAHIGLLPYASRLNKRVFVSKQAMDEFKLLLTNNLYGSSHTERLTYICNGTKVADVLPAKSQPFKVLFVGRDSPEKRFELFVQIADNFTGNSDIVFEAAGISSAKSYGNVSCLGELTQSELNELYKSAHILLLTSSREGFPMVIIEAMAAGVVPVSTAVGDIPNHINGDNGVVIRADDAARIVTSMIQAIESLIGNPAELNRLSANANSYAQNHFMIEDFQSNYRSLFGL